MSNSMNWPVADFTIQELINLNPSFTETAVRKSLADGITAKKIVQTQKGDKKVKGKFKLIKPM